MILKNKLIKILNALHKLKLSKNAIIGKHSIIYYTSSISLIRGAKKENTIIEDNARLYGSIVNCGKGKIHIGAYSALGANSLIRCINSVIIGTHTAISTNVIIQDNNTHPVNPADRLKMMETPAGHISRGWYFSDNAAIIIGNNCWIGENSRICKGVTIGDGSIIAANAVITHDVPQNSIAAGNPAKIVKTNIDKTAKIYFDKWPIVQS